VTLGLTVLALSACALTQKKPMARQTCAPETVERMKKLGVESGRQTTVVLEAGQPGSANEYGVYRQGQLTSQLEGALGDLPAGTLLDGVLWMETGKVQAHYTTARTPDGQTHPVCLVLGASAPGGMYAEAGTTPGAITLPRSVPVTSVATFE
jgi:serine/threonine-protein kinase